MSGAARLGFCGVEGALCMIRSSMVSSSTCAVPVLALCVAGKVVDVCMGVHRMSVGSGKEYRVTGVSCGK